MADVVEISNWNGYENKKDISNMSVNTLAPGTVNFLINDGEMVCTRPGLTLAGDEALQSNFGIRSSMDFSFKNNVGASLTLKEFDNKHYCWYRGKWRFIGETNVAGGHEYHYAEVWDDKTKTHQLIMVNGTGNIYSWTGAISEVTNVTGTTVTILDDALPLFLTPSGSFISNGIIYSFTGISGKQLTGVTPNPVGQINNGDTINYQIVTSQPKLNCDIVNGRFDVVESLDNHAFYIDYLNRTGYVSNSFKRNSEYLITYPVANSLIDLTVTGTYTPMTCAFDEYKIVITKQKAQSITSFISNNPSAGTPSPHNTPTTGYTPIFRDNLIIPHNASYTIRVLDAQLSLFAIDIVDNDTGITYTNPSVTLFPNSWAQISATGFSYAGVDFFVPESDTLNDLDVIVYDNGGYDAYSVYKNGSLIANNVIATNTVTDSGLTFKFETFYGKKVGDTILINCRPQIDNFWADFTFHTPLRQAGDGFVFNLDAPGVGIKATEKYIYISTASGKYYEVGFNLRDNGYEDVVVNRLKTEQVNKLLHQNYFTHLKNSLGILTVNRVFDDFGRVQSISTPQSVPLSDRIKNDFKRLRYLGKNKVIGTNVLDGYLNGQALFYDDMLIITAPRDGVVLIYDFMQGFWQAPQMFYVPIGRLSVCDGQLVGHSSINDESYFLFRGSNDNGNAFVSKLVLPFNSYGLRSRYKDASLLFTEGYMTQNSCVTESVLFDFGCGGQHVKTLKPRLCDVIDRASLGKGGLGSHGFANDPRIPIYKFHEQSRFNTGVTTFYESSISYTVSSVDSSFCLISCGLDAVESKQDVNYQMSDTEAKCTVITQGIPGTPQSIETGPFGDLTGNPNGPTDDRDIDDSQTFWGNVSTQ